MGKFSGALPTPSWKRAERKIAVGRCPHLDKILGLNEPISRRDFLDGTLVASAGMLVAGACPFPLSGQAASEISSGWTGYTGEGDYQAAAGNTEPVIQSARVSFSTMRESLAVSRREMTSSSMVIVSLLRRRRFIFSRPIQTAS